MELNPTQEAIGAVARALLSADYVAAARLLEPVAGGPSLLKNIERVIVPALDAIGEAWSRGEVALAQVYTSGRICERLVDDLLRDAQQPRRCQPRMAIAVLDDYHLLGKRLVHASLRAGGFEVADFGRVTPVDLVRRTVDEDIELLLISVLMLPSALRVADVRDGLTRAGRTARLVVGGAPFRLDPDLWRQVGADASGPTAESATRIVTELCGGGTWAASQ